MTNYNHINSNMIYCDYIIRKRILLEFCWQSAEAETAKCVTIREML